MESETSDSMQAAFPAVLLAKAGQVCCSRAASKLQRNGMFAALTVFNGWRYLAVGRFSIWTLSYGRCAWSFCERCSKLLLAFLRTCLSELTRFLRLFLLKWLWSGSTAFWHGTRKTTQAQNALQALLLAGCRLRVGCIFGLAPQQFFCYSGSSQPLDCMPSPR